MIARAGPLPACARCALLHGAPHRKGTFGLAFAGPGQSFLKTLALSPFAGARPPTTEGTSPARQRVVALKRGQGAKAAIKTLGHAAGPADSSPFRHQPMVGLLSDRISLAVSGHDVPDAFALAPRLTPSSRWNQLIARFPTASRLDCCDSGSFRTPVPSSYRRDAKAATGLPPNVKLWAGTGEDNALPRLCKKIA